MGLRPARFYLTLPLMSGGVLFFTDNTVDRSTDVRLNAGELGQLQSSVHARYLLVRRGRVKVEPDAPARIAWIRRRDADSLGLDTPVFIFLGRYEGTPRFAIVPREPPLTADDRFQTNADGDGYVGLRRAATTMVPAEAQMAAHAVHMSNWINRNRHCGSCALPMQVLEGGHKLLCSSPGCGREEFPRTDPVVIMLVVCENRCLLARQPKFPPRFYSAIAGFVEPGETLEDAVRREVQEEAGVAVGDVAYVGSQPWPFPTSLMVGYIAQAKTTDFKLDRRELEDGRWFERTEVERMISRPGEASEILLPPHGVMARRLIDEWIVRGR